MKKRKRQKGEKENKGIQIRDEERKENNEKKKEKGKEKPLLPPIKSSGTHAVAKVMACEVVFNGL